MAAGTHRESADLVEGVLQILLWTGPGGNSITEEHKVLEDPRGVDTDHGTDTPEGRVLLLVVTDTPQRVAPHADELGEEGGEVPGADQPQTANGDGSVLQQSLGSAWAVDVGNELLEHKREIRFHPLLELQGELANGPRGIVADGDVGGVQVPAQDAHKVTCREGVSGWMIPPTAMNHSTHQHRV